MQIFHDKKYAFLAMLFVLPAIFAHAGLEGTAFAQEAEDQDVATGRPTDISPGPYMAPGSVTRDPFAEPLDQGRPLDRDIEEVTIGRRPNPEQEIEGGSDDTFAPGVEADELLALDPAAIGILDAASGALAFDIWRGTPREKALGLIARLPVATSSPTVNDLSARLLLSPARVPGSNAGDVSIDFLLARLERIAASGDLSAMNTLLARLPERLEDPRLRQITLDMALLSGDTITACAIARDARAEDGAAGWLKILTFCRATSGDRAGAAFNLALLAETNEAGTEFERLIDDILYMADGGEIVGTPLSNVRADALDPLMVAMLRVLGREIPVDVLARGPRMMLASFAARADLSVDFRADAGELATLYGVMSGDTYGDVLGALDFTEGELNSVALLAETNLGARIDGLIIFAAMQENDAAARARLLSTGFLRARSSGRLTAMAGPLGGAVDSLTPAAGVAFFAGDAGRIALFNGDDATARRWYDVARARAAISDDGAIRSLLGLWPLMIIADASQNVPYDSEILSLWRQSLSSLPAAEQSRKAGMLYAMLDVFGYPVEDRFWLDAMAGPGAGSGHVPAHALWREFLVASRGGRIGEGLALGLQVIGSDGPGAMDLSALTSLLANFHALGLADEARKLAIEALITNGF
jgi:hypothetical protein